MKIIDINNRERKCERVFLDPAWPGYVSVEFRRTSDPTKTRIEWMPLSDFAPKNPKLSHLWEDKSTAPAQEFSGIVSHTGADHIIDAEANWPRNLYTGYYLWISRGPGEGQTRIIKDNTTNKITIDKPWGTKPTKDSQYSVVVKLPDNTEPQGNVLPTTELRKLEELARKKDIEMGREPAPRQYTQSKKKK